jgi:hypothetical protein
MPGDYQVGAYYFGNYHLDPRNEAVHGPSWTEWELVKRAVPRFPGHPQPRVPLWGYEDEADPRVFARKIDAAADHGIDYFIFDWYAYDDGFFLNRCLDEGYLGAPNCERAKFCLMWANHDWIDIHPAKAHQKPDLLYPGRVAPQTFDRLMDQIILRYFKHPSYWGIGGCPYFSIYELGKFVASFGSVPAARAALDEFRSRAQRAGLPGLHLNAVLWGQPILPGETVPTDPGRLLETLGFDSFTSYVWIHHVRLPDFPATAYGDVRERYLEYWQRIASEIPRLYFPNVTMGWDSSPRTVQSDVFCNLGYPFMPTLVQNTPEAFREALGQVKARLAEQPSKILNINAWNEWTEGSYLEPDTAHGYAYLEAIKAVFCSS